MAAIVPDSGLLADAAQARTALNGGLVHLYTNNYTPVPTTVTGDFTEAAFTGYASQTPAFGAPTINGSSQAQMDMAPDLSWTTTAASPGQNVYGYWLDNGTDIWAAEKFATGPFDMSALGASLDLAISYLVGSM